MSENCVACTEKLPTITLPCKHKNLCRDCLFKMVSLKRTPYQAPLNCPTCRREFHLDQVLSMNAKPTTGVSDADPKEDSEKPRKRNPVHDAITRRQMAVIDKAIQDGSTTLYFYSDDTLTKEVLDRIKELGYVRKSRNEFRYYDDQSGETQGQDPGMCCGLVVGCIGTLFVELLLISSSISQKT